MLSEQEAGNIEDLTDLLAEDWAQLGTCREMGKKTIKFFRTELENTWGSSHIAIFDEEEARNWVLGVGICYRNSYPPVRFEGILEDAP